PDTTTDCAGSGSLAAATNPADGSTTADGTATGTTTTDTTTTAACKFGWGAAGGVEDFDDAGLGNWSRYDGPGHDGNGIRSPDAMSVNNGVLTITGDANGTTGGM